jgi:glutamyl-tRNA synthetase
MASQSAVTTAPYRGRIAPTPSGLLHEGHLSTFRIAWERARQNQGAIIYRCEDLDQARCKPEFDQAAQQWLREHGLDWDEGPDIGGDFAPYTQNQRNPYYRQVWQKLAATGFIYPSPHSRKDVNEALSAPHPQGKEPIFPAKLRPTEIKSIQESDPGPVNWRFKVPDGEVITFEDGRCGSQQRIAGKDFGDFLVWRKDGFPSYELAVVADDQAMQITEVVRGEDLLTSTARQILLYRTLGWKAPNWYHCPLIRDPKGNRLAKRNAMNRPC